QNEGQRGRSRRARGARGNTGGRSHGTPEGKSRAREARPRAPRNRASGTHTPSLDPKASCKASLRVSSIAPQLATVGRELPTGDDWVFEPKYDGIRILAFADRGGVALVSRNGIDKAKQFPEVVEAVKALRARAKRALVLDGEIVATHAGGPARFQR